MINNYLGKFQALGYTREELELLLEKINNNSSSSRVYPNAWNLPR